MKLTLIIFLGFCALSVQASTTLDFDKEVRLLELTDLTLDGIYNKLKEYIDSLVSKLTETVEDIIEKFNTVVYGIVEKIKELIQKALDKFNSIRQRIQDKIKKLQQQSAITRECAVKLAQDIVGTWTDSKDNIVACMTTAEQKLAALKERVQHNIATIREKSAILAGIFTNGIDAEDKIGTILCVLKDAKEVIASITTLTISAKDLVDAARGEAADFIPETAGCVGVAYDDGKAKVDAIHALVEKCIEEVSHPTLLLH